MSIKSRRFTIGVGTPCGVLPSPDGSVDRYQMLMLFQKPSPESILRRSVLGMGIPSCNILPKPEGDSLNKNGRYQILGYPIVQSSATKIYSNLTINSLSSSDVNTKVRHFSSAQTCSSSSQVITSNMIRLRSSFDINCLSSFQNNALKILISGKSYIYFPSTIQRIIVLPANVDKNITFNLSITEDAEL